MEKKRSTTRKTGSALALQRETLQRLADSELRGAAGGARIYKPVGFNDDTTPIYVYEDEP
jgi:hypothetical protein